MLIWGGPVITMMRGEKGRSWVTQGHAQTLKPLSTLSFCRSPTLTGHSWRGSRKKAGRRRMALCPPLNDKVDPPAQRECVATSSPT